MCCVNYLHLLNYSSLFTFFKRYCRTGNCILPAVSYILLIFRACICLARVDGTSLWNLPKLALHTSFVCVYVLHVLSPQSKFYIKSEQVLEIKYRLYLSNLERLIPISRESDRTRLEKYRQLCGGRIIGMKHANKY